MLRHTAPDRGRTDGARIVISPLPTMRVRVAHEAPRPTARPAVVVVDGSVDEWRSASGWMPVAGSIVLGVVRAGDELVGPLACCCDLRALLGGRASDSRDWNLHAAAESDVDVWIRAIERAVEERPLAAGALAGCLRVTSRVAPSDGLVVESLTYSMLQSGPEHSSWLTSRL